jgi:hypothetical protein
MGTQSRAEAERTGTWEITGRMGVGFINPATGRASRRPLP